MEHRMGYRGCGCLFFAKNARSEEYLQYDSRALSGLKKRWKEEIDKIEGPKVKGQKYPTEQWTI